MTEPYIIMPAAAKRISNELKLPFTGDEQDWDLEAADSFRVEEFITFYKSHQYLTSDEKVALMALTLASYDDLANSSAPEENLWNEIKPAIISEWKLLYPLINYWSSLKSTNADPFIVGKRLRELQTEMITGPQRPTKKPPE